MKKRAHQILLSLFYLLFAWSPVKAISGWDSSCVGTGEAEDVATIGGLQCVFENVLTIVLRLIGLSTFIMIVVGGFKYLTSGGDPKAAESAKNTITYGIIGLVLVIAAWFILLAISSFTGVDLTKFELINPNP